MEQRNIFHGHDEISSEKLKQNKIKIKSCSRTISTKNPVG
jgi:hypothetical protein